MRHSLGQLRKVALVPAAKAGHSNDAFGLPVITSAYIAHILGTSLCTCWQAMPAMGGLVGIFTWAALRAEAEKLLECFYIYCVERSEDVQLGIYQFTRGIASFKEMLGWKCHLY